MLPSLFAALKQGKHFTVNSHRPVARFPVDARDLAAGSEARKHIVQPDYLFAYGNGNGFEVFPVLAGQKHLEARSHRFEIVLVIYLNHHPQKISFNPSCIKRGSRDPVMRPNASLLFVPFGPAPNDVFGEPRLT